jgi:hypothetical protein
MRVCERRSDGCGENGVDSEGNIILKTANESASEERLDIRLRSA